MLLGIVIFTLALMNYRREGFVDGPSGIQIFLDSPAIFKLAIVVLIIGLLIIVFYKPIVADV